jgi:NAD(P)-dependent dehydrogenase (short-subunit alcohol dehydrogenase family)
LDLVDERRGWCVVISSSAVSSPPADWPHYVAAKHALEGLTQTVAREYPNVSFLVVRPPRLLTDLTNSPLGRNTAMRVAPVAASVIRRILGEAAPGRVELLDTFEVPSEVNTDA